MKQFIRISEKTLCLMSKLIRKIIGMVSLCLLFYPAYSQFTLHDPKTPGAGEIAVSKPGFYGEPGRTYILVNDISDAKSTIFLGKDITLDLNGHTITYADGNYGHIPNYSFEEGLKEWDISMAPGATIEGKKVQVMIGDKILRLKAGEEIVSPLIHVPIADRSYFAMCGVASMEMKVSIFVEDNIGNRVRCLTRYGDKEVVSCPAENLSPRLGGGIVYAHLSGQPPGKYRIRIKAVTDCLIDYVDLRPSTDVGIGIIEEIQPWVNYSYLYNSIHGAFFDYRSDIEPSLPLAGIPVVRGKGTITIKNGIIKNGTEGILSWGIQSTARDVTIILDNVKIITSGINTNALDVAQAIITNCTFNVNNPFIINRHGTDGYAVDLWGKSPSEISFSEFYGGQGCLVFKGDFSKIHHNYFANRQSVTNHYSIMATGDSSLIFENKIIPETGSGIEIYVHRGMEIFNNEIKIQAAPPTCEYGHTDYSTSAIRIADYNAAPLSLNASYGNKVYNNKIEVTGKDYPDYSDYIPMAYAVFYSASGGENYFFGNEITVEDLTPNSKNETSAFYIGGGSNGGSFYNNRITTNMPAFWIATRYGGAENVNISDNLIIKSSSADTSFKPIRIGWSGNIAKSIKFRSNIIKGSEFGIEKTDIDHSFSVYWTLTVKVEDKKGNPVKGCEISILDANGNNVFNQKTGKDGILKAELQEYSIEGSVIHNLSPFMIISGRNKEKIILNSNKELIIIRN